MNSQPKDLLKYAKTYVVKKIAVLAFGEVLLALILFLWGDTLLGSSTGIVKIGLYVLVLALPFAVTKMPFCLVDRSYFGTIEKVDLETCLESAIKGKPTTERTYTAVTLLLTIKEAGNGRVHTVKIGSKGSTSEKRGAWDMYSVGGDDSFVKNAEQTFSVGARVFHLYGTEHVVILPDEKAQNVRCAVCGENNPTSESICRKCGHTLVK